MPLFLEKWKWRSIRITPKWDSQSFNSCYSRVYQFSCSGKAGNWVAKSKNGYHFAFPTSDGCAVVSRPTEFTVVKIIIKPLNCFLLCAHVARYTQSGSGWERSSLLLPFCQVSQLQDNQEIDRVPILPDSLCVLQSQQLSLFSGVHGSVSYWLQNCWVTSPTSLSLFLHKVPIPRSS